MSPTQHFQVRPLTPVLGAEVVGLRLNEPLSDDAFSRLRQAWNDAGGLLVIREQHIDVEQHLAFSRRFGPLFGEDDHFQDTVQKYLLPGQPGIYRVSNKVAGGIPQGRSRAGNYWHSDVSFRAHPAMASLLYAIELPSVGGDTLFANMSAVYRSLSTPMQALLAPLEAVHDFRSASANYWNEEIESSDFDGRNRICHPVVTTHPETGDSVLFVNPGFVAGLVGFDAEESHALLAFLYQQATRPEHIYRHRWCINDLVIWDNRCLMHYAVADYDEDRYLHRTTVIAEKPER